MGRSLYSSAKYCTQSLWHRENLSSLTTGTVVKCKHISLCKILFLPVQQHRRNMNKAELMIFLQKPSTPSLLKHFQFLTSHLMHEDIVHVLLLLPTQHSYHSAFSFCPHMWGSEWHFCLYPISITVNFLSPPPPRYPHYPTPGHVKK